ncbi:hypothetical protein DRJ22_00565 [Candidatus Woesearchaeota archaeon]|nr:MAG: hypothetical protein B6U93_00220 [Candidatus Woesearchaeota archaeon ex4484_78]RLE46985.1 MAG: hypothetical protein DRJ22_00565 [Candidatus Woesearchaeota archaeon]
MEIKLDKKSLKALSNDTRAEIFKLLGKRRHTQSEIAEKLGLSVPTIKEHLQELAKAGLIERHEEGRKWKYYALTKKGKGVLNPEETKILLLLATTIITMTAGILTYLKSIPKRIIQTTTTNFLQNKIITTGSSELETQKTLVIVIKPSEAYITLSFIFLFITIILIILLAIHIKENKKRKKMLGKNLTKK